MSIRHRRNLSKLRMVLRSAELVGLCRIQKRHKVRLSTVCCTSNSIQNQIVLFKVCLLCLSLLKFVNACLLGTENEN